MYFHVTTFPLAHTLSVFLHRKTGTFYHLEMFGVGEGAYAQSILPTLTLSVGVGRTFCLFVCLFVRSITQKRMTAKCSNLVQGMTFGYPRSGVVLGLKGQRSRSQGQSISAFLQY